MIYAVSHEWCDDKAAPWSDSWRVFKIDKLSLKDSLNFAYWGTFEITIDDLEAVTMETDHCYVEATDEVDALQKGQEVIKAKYKKINQHCEEAQARNER